MKEHAGGSPEIALESWADESFAMPIVHFPFDDLDKLEDRLREALNGKGVPIPKVLAPYLSRYIETVRAQTLWSAFELIRKHKNPHQAIDQILWVSGCFGLLDSETGPSLARKHGISKQAFQQAADRLAKQLNLRKARTMRDDVARQKMRLRNSRR